ncbi:NAD-dependent epimerase/dehydratase family protein, partial [bacterium]
DLQTSHVLPALIRKFHEAKATNAAVEVWGSGRPRREFLYSDDVADAIHHLLRKEGVEGFVNVGTGTSVSIRELAETVQRVVGHGGEMAWNTSMPDGFPEKTMDVTKLHRLGWHHRIQLEEGVRLAYEWFLQNEAPRLAAAV